MTDIISNGVNYLSKAVEYAQSLKHTQLMETGSRSGTIVGGIIADGLTSIFDYIQITAENLNYDPDGTLGLVESLRNRVNSHCEYVVLRQPGIFKKLTVEGFHFEQQRRMNDGKREPTVNIITISMNIQLDKDNPAQLSDNDVILKAFLEGIPKGLKKLSQNNVTINHHTSTDAVYSNIGSLRRRDTFGENITDWFDVKLEEVND